MKHDQPLLTKLPPIDVSRETEARLRTLIDLVQRWSTTINLVGRGDLALLWERHVLDTLQILPLLQTASGLFADLGSGAGFPGLVLSIAADRPVHLIEADQRKAAFLREATRATGAAATIHATRIEAARLPAPAACITARALAPLSSLLALAHPLLAKDGICLFPKGATATAELQAARADWQMRATCWQSRTHEAACVIEISQLAPA